MADVEPNIVKLLRILLRPIQTAENALQQLLNNRSVTTAVGAQLTLIGKLVGEPRNGVTDDNLYRRYVNARIATNRSNGTGEDIIRVANLVLSDPTLKTVIAMRNNASYVLRIEGGTVSAAIAQILISFVKQATAAGVRVTLEYSTVPPAELFIWDTPGRGWDNGKFADATH